MIRKFLPTVILVAAAALCALFCLGALTAAAAVWLSSYWGLVGGLLAVAGGLAVLACILLLIARLRRPKPRQPAAEARETLVALWRARPVTSMLVIGVAAFIVARKPSLVARLATAAAQSGGANAMLKRFLDKP